MRAVHGFVAPSGPTRAPQDEPGMILGAYIKCSGGLVGHPLGLEVTLEAEILVALNEHFVIRAAMRIVAGGAAFANGFVFENEWPALLHMALHTGVLLDRHGSAAAANRLAFVRVVTVAAGNFAVLDGMVVWRVELGFFIEMTLEASFRVPLWIEDCVARAAAFVVNAARPVAGFATHLLRVRALRHQARVIGSVEILGDVLVALFAGFAADERGAFDVRRDHDRSLDCCARDHRDRGRQAKQRRERCFARESPPR
jgi:hypothetical protein